MVSDESWYLANHIGGLILLLVGVTWIVARLLPIRREVLL